MLKNLATYIPYGNNIYCRYGITTAGVLVGLILALVIKAVLLGGGSSGVPYPVEVQSPHEIVQRHLQWAEQERAAGAEPHLRPVREFFEAARMGSRAFAEDSLGWDSKWTLGQDYLTGSNEHPAYLQSRFDLRIFRWDDLDQLLNQVVASYLKHLDDVDSMMLVRLEQDLATLPSSSFAMGVDQEKLHIVLDEALAQAVAMAQGDFRGMIGRELVSFVVGEVLTVATASLATSAGILGTGAASGWATFGAGVVVGLIVDAVVTEIYSQTFNPIGELSDKLNAQLTQMESLIVDGATDAPGLRGSLNSVAMRRATAIRQSVETAVLANLSP